MLINSDNDAKPGNVAKQSEGRSKYEQDTLNGDSICKCKIICGKKKK